MKQEIMKHLPGNFPWQVHWYNDLPSTNDLLKEMGKAGAPHGTVVIADSQSKGRGRLGRSFLSPAGNGIYLSVLLRPRCKAYALMHLTCAVAVAMCDAVEQVCAFRPGAKWINDLVSGSKKLGGILTEMSLAGDGDVAFCVIGIGINCKKSPVPPELEAIVLSLEEATGKEIDRFALIGAMLTALLEMEQGLFTNKAAIMERYRQDCVTLRKTVSILGGEAPVTATALDVDADGALLVRYPDGREEFLSSGEISVRGMYGYQ